MTLPTAVVYTLSALITEHNSIVENIMFWKRTEQRSTFQDQASGMLRQLDYNLTIQCWMQHLLFSLDDQIEGLVESVQRVRAAQSERQYGGVQEGHQQDDQMTEEDQGGRRTWFYHF